MRRTTGRYRLNANADAKNARYSSDQIVMMAFGLILGAAAVATALAFGLGGRDAASRILERWAENAPPPRPAPPRRIRSAPPSPDDEQPPLV